MNMIDSAKAQVRQLTAAAYDKAAAAGLLPAGIAVEPAVEIPKDTANGGLHLRLGQRPVRHCRLIGGHGQRRRLVLRVLYHVDHIVPSFVNEEFRMRNFGVRQSRTDSNCHLRRHRNS